MIQSFHILNETHALCMILVMNEKKEIPHARQAILVKNKSFFVSLWNYYYEKGDSIMEKLDQFYGLFIDGEFCESSDKARFKTYSPATGEVLAEVAEATREDVDRAVSCAWKAFASWKKLDKVSR